MEAPPPARGTAPGLDDLLDGLVAEYSDRLARGEAPDRPAFLARVPPTARPGLERVLRTLEAGLAGAEEPPQPLRAGLRLGPYVLVREVGRGGMAHVWLARDEALARPVAVKVLRPGLALERSHVERFEREGRTVAQLRHPHVVQVFGVGRDAGHPWLAMEYVEGPSLATVVEALPTDRPPTADDLALAAGAPELAADGATFETAAARLLAPVARALHAAHERGLVHRDVKPSNILLARGGRPLVADFGLAKADGDPALSLSGATIGTPYYMSPEQARLTEAVVDHRTDVYSLGVTLFELLTLKRPFRGDTFLEVIESIRTQVAPGLRAVSARFSRDADAVVRRAMAREPGARYADAAALAADLESLAAGGGTRALAEQGGRLRRLFQQWRLFSTGLPYEYRSPRTFLGLPLVHVVRSPRLPGGKRRKAVGWLAIGDLAVGGVAVGNVALGLVAWGGIGVGLLFSFAGIGLGTYTFAGLAAGVYPLGGVSAGYVAVGGFALGYGAMGGFARGVYAAGGNADGTYVVDGRTGREDPEVEAFLARAIPEPVATLMELWWGGGEVRGIAPQR